MTALTAFPKLAPESYPTRSATSFYLAPLGSTFDSPGGFWPWGWADPKPPQARPAAEYAVYVPGKEENGNG